MIKKPIKNSLLSLVVLLVVLFVPALAFAQAAPTSVCGGPNLGNPTLNKITDSIRYTLLEVGGVLAVVGFVVAGILYLTSGGGEKMSIAKKALIAAVIGTFLVAMAGAINILFDIFCWLFW